MKYNWKDAIPILEEHLKTGNLIPIVGSGVSVSPPSNLPMWDGLIKVFMKMAKDLPLTNKIDKDGLLAIINDAEIRETTGRFDPIKISTSLKRKLETIDDLKKDGHPAYSQYKGWVANYFNSPPPNDFHKTLLKINFPFIFTTNYDNLLEKAAIELGYSDFDNGKDYKDEMNIITTIQLKKPGIIHLHGMANKLSLNELIFTKEDYNELILKSYPGYSFALRMFFTRYSTIFIGYGGSDPHLEEILDELHYYFPFIEGVPDPLPQAYLIVKEDKADTIDESYHERKRTHLIIVKNYDESLELLDHLSKNFPRV